MKIVILGDLHFGCRNNNKYFYGKQVEFINNILLPYLDKNKIDRIIQTGDLFDIRKNISLETLHNIKRDFFTPLLDRKIELITIAGNHDLAMRDNPDVYTSPLVLSEYPNVICIPEWAKIEVDGKTIDLCGWLCKSNKEALLRKIKQSTSDICIGHFELSNFPMYQGIDAMGGYDQNFLSHYDLVLSGHYHTKSHNRNIQYVGTCYEMDFNDRDDPKGFHILDTEDLSLEFIQNPTTIHHRIYYPFCEYPLTEDLTGYKDKIVELVITDKDKHLEKFIDRLYKSKAHQLTFNDLSEVMVNEAQVEINTESTINILIDTIRESDMKNKIKGITLVNEIYADCLI